jgi:hypothetical protein
MAGYSFVRKVHELEERCEKLGFMMAHSRHGLTREFGDTVALIPKDDDSLPIYSRDAEFFVGTLETLEVWLRGLEWAREYDRILKVSDTAKRARKEQDERNRRLLRRLKEPAEADK